MTRRQPTCAGGRRRRGSPTGGLGARGGVLEAWRPVRRGRLWAVFGGAGGRDPARREGMGQVAGRLADRVVLTNEDPRDEAADAVIEAVAAGPRGAGRRGGGGRTRASCSSS